MFLFLIWFTNGLSPDYSNYDFSSLTITLNFLTGLGNIYVALLHKRRYGNAAVILTVKKNFKVNQ